MKINQIISIITAIFLCSSLSFAQELTAVQYEELKIQAGQDYKNKQFLDAYEKLMSAYRENPSDTTLYIPIARSAFSAKRYNQAIMAYEKAIETNMENKAQIYSEMAIVYGRLKDYEQARAYLDLARANGNEAQNLNIDKLITQLKTLENTTKISGGVSIGAGWDSNANGGPDSRDVVLGTLPITLSDGIQAQSSGEVHGSLWLNLVEGFNPRNDKYFLIADLNLYTKEFFEKDVEENNFLWNKVAVGLRTTMKDAYFDIQAIADYTSFDYHDSVYSYGLQAKLNKKMSSNTTALTTINFNNTKYQSQSDIGGNGKTFLISEQMRFILSNKESLSWTLGYLNKDANSDRLAYRKLETSLRYINAIRNNLYIIPSAGFYTRDYKDSATALEQENRNDDTLWTGLTAMWYFQKNLSADISYRYTKNDSNSEVYDYDQSAVSLSLGYYF